jgi:hypothetical protein
MTAAMGTLIFLSTLWLLVVVGAAVLEESGAKIAAALKGKHPAPSPSFGVAPARARSRSAQMQPRRVPGTWRAAA